MHRKQASLGHRHRPLRDVVCDEVRDRIVGGTYAPGERLYEDRLARELDVSRNPIREALQALTAEGFVVIEPRRGARVAEVDARRAGELFDVREALEGLVAARAAEHRTADQIEQLEVLVERGVGAAERNETAELPRLNTEFHDLLAVIADNVLLTTTLDQLSGVIRWIYAERVETRAAMSWKEHGDIAAAIAAGDRRGARRLAEAHVAAARVAYLTPTRGRDTR